MLNPKVRVGMMLIELEGYGVATVYLTADHARLGGVWHSVLYENNLKFFCNHIT
jgi:hypothetical protein